MARSLTLTTAAGSINFEDGVNYRVPRASEQETIQYQTVENPIRNTSQINLGMFKMVSRTFAFDLFIKGASWTDILSRISTIQGLLNSAASYSMFQTGSQATLTELQGNQSVPTTYYVVYGKLVEDRKQRLVTNNYTFARVEIVCEPGAH